MELEQKKTAADSWGKCLEGCGITLFEYNLKKDATTLLTGPKGAALVVAQGAEGMLRYLKVLEEGAGGYRQMFASVKDGAAFAQCQVQRHSGSGIQACEIIMHTQFGSDGRPVGAAGVQRNVSQLVQLQQEQAFSKALCCDKSLVLEADLTVNWVGNFGAHWKQALGPAAVAGYRNTIQVMVRQFVALEQQEKVLAWLQPENLAAQYAAGNSLSAFDYKRQEETNTPEWYEATIGIIKAPVTSNLRIRLYSANVNETRIGERRALEERKLYESMVAKAMISYEINLTQNRFLTGHEDWAELFSIDLESGYSKMTDAFAQKAVHPEDREGFMRAFGSAEVLRRYKSGQSSQHCEYRKKDGFGIYCWVSCAMYLFAEAETGDVKAYVYVEDIDAQKRRELELRYRAEHDALTGLFNRAAMERAVNSYLKQRENRSVCHAFFIIDIDHFKEINDNFGHPYGDEVICSFGATIRALFREEDTVARIGGDEFCVFMKHVDHEGIVHKKAQLLCEKLSQGFAQDGKTCRVSASVGVALYPMQGESYQALYAAADEALYVAKDAGKNRYEMQGQET